MTRFDAIFVFASYSVKAEMMMRYITSRQVNLWNAMSRCVTLCYVQWRHLIYVSFVTSCYVMFLIYKSDCRPNGQRLPWRQSRSHNLLSTFKNVVPSPKPLDCPTTVLATATSRRPAYGIDTMQHGSRASITRNAVATQEGGLLKLTDVDSGYSLISESRR